MGESADRFLWVIAYLPRHRNFRRLALLTPPTPAEARVLILIHEHCNAEFDYKIHLPSHGWLQLLA
jgi:hypothetical protein